MPTLSTQRETQTIKLPVSGGEVTMYENVKARDLNDLDIESTEEMNPTTMVSVLIQEWNFTDEDGNELEPTDENIGLLELQDFTAILEAADLGDFLDEENQPTES